MTDKKSDAYLDTIARLEPEIAMIDPGAYYASAAISLKRIADTLEKIAAQNKPYTVSSVFDSVFGK